jgi:hypothetical protein
VLLSIVPALTPPVTTSSPSKPAAASPGGTTTTTAAQPAATSTNTIPSLDSIFDLTSNEKGLVIAAIFGLTPTLLVARLRAQSEGLKSGLKSSELGGETTPG